MTNGSSQGLFVIVAVVIFGIFVAISYILFRDNLGPSMSAIFTDSISTATNYEQIINKGEEGDYHYGFYPLKGDNEGMYVEYFAHKTEDKAYLFAFYERKENGELVKYTHGEKLKGHLELPDTIEGKKVVGLSVNKGTQTGNWTLSKAKITSVKLPRYLETIPEGLFNEATNLKSIVGGIPESVTSIGTRAFTNTKLEGELTIPANVESIGTEAFRGVNLTKVIFKNINTIIQPDSFKETTIIEGLLS